MKSTHMLVAVGRGARLWQLARRATTCLKVKFTGAEFGRKTCACAAGAPGGNSGNKGGGRGPFPPVFASATC